MSMNELNTTARDLMSVRAMIEELQAEAEALADKLKAAMVEQGTEALQGDGWKATWKNVNSQRFDSKSFKADHADLYSQYSRQTTTTRFVLSVCAAWTRSGAICSMPCWSRKRTQIPPPPCAGRSSPWSST